MGSHALELYNYVIPNSCEVELFVKYTDGNEGVVDDNFSVDFKDSNDESLKDVWLDDSEEERTIGLDDGFDLPIPEIGRMKNKRIKRVALKMVCNPREKGDSSDYACVNVFIHIDDDIANMQCVSVELIKVSNDYFNQEENLNLPSEV